MCQSDEGVKALLAQAGNRLDLELGWKVNNATAVQIAAYLSTYVIFEALVHAGANVRHR